MMATNSLAGVLIEVATNYLDFLNLAGQTPDSNLENKLTGLCAFNCTKIVNDETLFTTSDAFVPQLRKAHETFGKWKINQNYRIAPSESDRSFTIKYVAETEKKGDLLAMAILKVTSAYSISEIDEIYVAKEKPKE